MRCKTKLTLLLALSASTIAYGATTTPCFAEDDEPALPLVLSGEDNEETPAAEEETLPPPPVVEEVPLEENDDLVLPPAEEEGTGEDDIPYYIDPDAKPLTQEEMEDLSNQPLFKEFTTTIDELAPLPEEIDVESLNVPGAQLIVPEPAPIAKGAVPSISIEEATAQLDEVLDFGDVDIDSLNLSPQNRRSLAQLDAEIHRLCPLWIDAEVNRGTIGRREFNWRQRAALYSVEDPEPIDANGFDWALAPDAPFFFQVTDSISGEVYYTKAGDFEQLDPMNLLSPGLVRDEKTYVLSLEPGKINPTGNSHRIKVNKNGRVQGLGANGVSVTDVDLAKVLLFTFDNPSRLASEDGVFFTPTQFSGDPIPANLLGGSKLGVTNGKVLPSNGKPEEIFARIKALCKSKKRLLEIISQPIVQ